MSLIEVVSSSAEDRTIEIHSDGDVLIEMGNLPSANLLALANLATAPDTLAYWTGAGTAALTALTGYARGLLACANSVAALTALGAEPAGAADAAIAAHIATADPHTQYRLESVNVPWGDISGTPTTLAGYGITDAQPLDTTLTALAGTAFGANGEILISTGTDFAWSGASLTYIANQLAGSGGSVPAPQASTAWALSGGVGRFGTQIVVDGTAAGSITTAGGVTAPSGLYVNGTSGAIKSFCQIQRGGVTAWFMSVRDATDDLRFRAYDDAGVAIDYPLTIARAAGGAITLTRPLTATSIAMAGALSGVTTLTASGLVSTTASGAFGASALLASERLLVSGGGALPSVGATQVAISNGGIACGAAVSAAGGFAASGSSSGVLAATIRNTNSGTAASANVIVENDLGSACRLNFGVQSSGYTSSVFGVTAANYTAIVTVGASTAGLMIGNASTGTPIIFGSGNIEVARLTSGTLASGSLDVKYTGQTSIKTAGQINMATLTPASASAAGTAGTIAWDASYIYVCTAANTWKRVAIATW